MAEQVPIREGTFKEDKTGAILLANRCKACGQIFFPKSKFCLSCVHKEMEEIELSQRGILYSYTIGHMPSSHFKPPYAIGYIDLPEKVRIYAPLVMTADQSFQVGMEMVAVIDKLWEEDDKEIIGYKFKPVDNAS
ncbi:OB-fold domain-containing protein [bacterium]|nr:OB-fold domain-containing protein [bacterium]